MTFDFICNSVKTNGCKNIHCYFNKDLFKDRTKKDQRLKCYRTDVMCRQGQYVRKLSIPVIGET
jgi:hypothetical protein